jgi:hypothetical protein
LHLDRAMLGGYYQRAMPARPQAVERNVVSSLGLRLVF